MPEKVEKDIEADNSEDPRSGERTATSANALRILLVEDHNDTRGVFANLLNRSGYLVSVADSVKSAVALLGIRKFDVLLSDLGLPDGSGYALLAQARQTQPSIKAVALTGFATPEDVQFSREAGFDFHLTKPVDFHQLRTLLEEVGPRTN